MANSSRPPQGPTDGSNLLAFRRLEETSTEVGGELMRRRSDVHDDVSKVSNIRPDITGRSVPTIVKARPKPKLVQETPNIPTIGRKGRLKDTKVAARIDADVMSDIRGATQLEEALSGMDQTLEPTSIEDTARALLKLRDDDLQCERFDQTFGDEYLLNTDREVFTPVAQAVARMFLRRGHQQHLNDKRIANITGIVRDPDTRLQALAGMLANYFRNPIPAQRQPAHNAPKGKGRVLKPKK